jgi:hypothetical protein
LKGIGVFTLSFTLSSLPILYALYTHLDDVLPLLYNASIFDHFSFAGDYVSHFLNVLGYIFVFQNNSSLFQMHGESLLWWPIGVFAVVGLLRSIVKLSRIRKHHGHFPPVNIFLLSLFVISFLITFLSYDLVSTFAYVPLLFTLTIFAGEGLWWFFEYCAYEVAFQERFDYFLHKRAIRQGFLLALFALIIFLTALTFNVYGAYFYDWLALPSVQKLYMGKIQL